MKKAILLILTTLALGACSNGGSDKQSPAAGDTQNKPSSDTTDRSACSGPTPAIISLQSNLWTATSTDENGFSLTTTFRFGADKVEEKAVGTLRGRSKDIYISSRYKVNGTKLSLLDTDSADGEILIENGRTTFSVEFKPMTVDYSFVGSCLKLELAGYPPEIFAPVVQK